jgi:hypothetical protein
MVMLQQDETRKLEEKRYEMPLAKPAHMHVSAFAMKALEARTKSALPITMSGRLLNQPTDSVAFMSLFFIKQGLNAFKNTVTLLQLNLKLQTKHSTGQPASYT